MPGDARAAQALLGEACKAGDLDRCKRAVAGGADPNAREHKHDNGAIVGGRLGGSDTAVIVAAHNGRAHVLRFLLAAAGGDPDRDAGDDSDGNSSSGKWTPGYFACSNHHHDCVRVLQALGAAPDHSTVDWDDSKCTCPPDIAR